MTEVSAAAPASDRSVLTEQVPTPFLAIDRDAFKSNMDRVAEFFKHQSSKLRPHVKSHKSVEIARQQLDAGGTVGGVCVSKVGEAEVMVAGGISDILITNEIVDPSKIGRLLRLARSARMGVLVDSLENVAQLDVAAGAAGIRLDVLIDLNTRMNRCGVEPGDAAARLGRAVAAASNLHLRGLNAYEGGVPIVDRKARAIVVASAIDKAIATAALLRGIGLAVETISCGGSSTWDLTGAIAGVTEVQAGGYLFLDASHREIETEFSTSLFVVASVTGHTRNGLAVLDVGESQISLAYGLPDVSRPLGLTVDRVGREELWLRAEPGFAPPPMGTQIWLVPGQCDALVNRFAAFHVISDGAVQDVWSIDAGSLSQ